MEFTNSKFENPTPMNIRARLATHDSIGASFVLPSIISIVGIM